MKRVLLSFLLFLSVYAEPPCLNVSPIRVEVRHREHRGIGYDDGYTTAALFATPTWERTFQPFLDFRAHLLNDGRFASNLGVGGRFHPMDQSSFVFGANLFYDYRSALDLSPHQLGGGIEALSRYIDVRVNGYLPVGTTKHVGAIEPGPMQTQVIALQRDVAVALPVIQGEVGVPLPWDIYFGAGPYYLFKKTAAGKEFGDAVGVQSRLSAQVFDGVELGVMGTYDSVFHGTFQGYLSFSYPLGPANMRKRGRRFKRNYKECLGQAKLYGRMTQRVRRAEIIPIEERTCVFTPFDPQGQPYRFVFVNNTSPFPGDGSFAMPYQTLAQAEATSSAGDLIYLLYNNGNATGLETGFVMKEGQTLHGSGRDVILDGQLVLPALTPNLSPTITQQAGASSAVTMANNTTVEGINFLNYNSTGIDATGAANFLVQYNTFQNNGVANGVAIDADGSPSGTKRILANKFDTNIFGAVAGSSDLSLRGGITDSVIIIADNDFLSRGFSAMRLNTISSNHRIVNNKIIQVSSPSAMVIENNGSGSKIFFESNDIESTAGAHMLIFICSNGEVDFDMRDNLFVNNSTHHIEMLVGPGGGDTAVVNALFDSNTLKSSGLATDVFLLGPSASQLCLELNNNKTDGTFGLTNNSGSAASYRVASKTGTAVGVSEQNGNATVIFSPGTGSFTFVPIGTCN